MPFRVLAVPLSLTLILAGCADSAAANRPTQQANSEAPHDVIGQASPRDRDVINTTNQQMFNVEHAQSTDMPVNAVAPLSPDSSANPAPTSPPVSQVTNTP